jgi:hypothetical protein
LGAAILQPDLRAAAAVTMGDVIGRTVEIIVAEDYCPARARLQLARVVLIENALGTLNSRRGDCRRAVDRRLRVDGRKTAAAPAIGSKTKRNKVTLTKNRIFNFTRNYAMRLEFASRLA